MEAISSKRQMAAWLELSKCYLREREDSKATTVQYLVTTRVWIIEDRCAKIETLSL